MLRAWQHRDQFQGGSDEGKALAWLRAILRNVVADKLDQAHAEIRDIDREQSIRAVDDSSARIEALLADRGPSPLEMVERQEQRLRLAEAIDQLDEAQRDALILHELLGLKKAEVARRLERSEQAVVGLLFRAKRKLTKLLKDE
jgi:RNA polymerase sigma-70 factor (ECF subfamily)